MLIQLTHANNKRLVFISPTHIAAIYQGSDGSTHVISVGAIIPVQETVDEVVHKIINNNQKENSNNGTKGN